MLFRSDSEKSKFIEKIKEETTTDDKNDYTNELSLKLLNLSDGLATFSNLAINYYFKDTLKLSPSQNSLCLGIISIPFIFKTYFGFLSDTNPLFNYKRKSYILINSILISLCWFLLAFSNPRRKTVVIILFFKAIGKSFLAACTSAVSVEYSKKNGKKGKKLESFNGIYLFVSVGTIVSSITRGIAWDYISINHMFLISGILSFLNIIAGYLYKEEKYNIYNDNNIYEENNFAHLRKLIGKKEIKLLFKYILIMVMAPSYYGVSFYYLTEVRGFSKRYFESITIILMFCFFLNSYINKKYLHKFKPKYVIIVCSLLSFFFGLFYNIYIYFEVDSKIFIVTGISLYLTFKALNACPIYNLLVLACPKGYEGSIMGLFTSVRELGKAFSSLIGSLFIRLFGIQRNQ